MRTVEDMQVELERWQARCLKAEGQLEESKQYAKGLAINMAAKWPAIESWNPLTDLYGLLMQIDNMAAGFIDRSMKAEAELTLIKGRQEWGVKCLIDIDGRPAGYTMKCQSEDSARRFMMKFPDAYELQWRYPSSPCGPWVPVKEKQG